MMKSKILKEKEALAVLWLWKCVMFAATGISATKVARTSHNLLWKGARTWYGQSKSQGRYFAESHFQCHQRSRETTQTKGRVIIIRVFEITTRHAILIYGHYSQKVRETSVDIDVQNLANLSATLILLNVNSFLNSKTSSMTRWELRSVSSMKRETCGQERTVRS